MNAKDYLKYYDISEQDKILCPVCEQRIIVDTNHIILRGMGGSTNKFINSMANQIPICRECHITFADQPKYYEMLFNKLTNFVKKQATKTGYQEFMKYQTEIEIIKAKNR